MPSQDQETRVDQSTYLRLFSHYNENITDLGKTPSQPPLRINQNHLRITEVQQSIQRLKMCKDIVQEFLTFGEPWITLGNMTKAMHPLSRKNTHLHKDMTHHKLFRRVPKISEALSIMSRSLLAQPPPSYSCPVIKWESRVSIGKITSPALNSQRCSRAKASSTSPRFLKQSSFYCFVNH